LGGASLSRRRFTRAGLSGSVLLGSLASKPVLGAVPYHCTVSGQVSGNLSRPEEANECVLGSNRATWLSADAWPSPFIKGKLPEADCSFNAQRRKQKNALGRGTQFNGYISSNNKTLSNAFYSVAGEGVCNVVTDRSENPTHSTMLEVLSNENLDEQSELGRVVVVSLLNAAQFQDTYPITDNRIVAMFNATFGGGYFYPVGGDRVTWGRSRVIDYLSSLYTPQLG
jgi:hypothetical protein